MVEAMRGTLNGNAQTPAALLQQHAQRHAATAGRSTWCRIDERLAAQVRTLRLSGRGGEVLGVEMEFIGGDRSVMTIAPVRARQPSSARPRERAAPAAAPTPPPLLRWRLAAGAGRRHRADRAHAFQRRPVGLPAGQPRRAAARADRAAAKRRGLAHAAASASKAARMRRSAPRCRAPWRRRCARAGCSTRCRTATPATGRRPARWLFEHRYQLSPGVDARALHRRRPARRDRRHAVAARHAGRQRDQAAAGARPDRRDAAHRRRPDPGERAAQRGRACGCRAARRARCSWPPRTRPGSDLDAQAPAIARVRERLRRRHARHAAAPARGCR